MATLKCYPLLCTRGAIIFPLQDLSIEIGRTQSINSVNRAYRDNMDIILTSQINAGDDIPTLDGIYKTGTLCRIKSIRNRDDHLKATFSGICRCRILEKKEDDDLYYIEIIQDHGVYNEYEAEVLCKKALNEFNNYAKKFQRPAYIVSANTIYDTFLCANITDTFAQVFVQGYNEKQRYLEERDVKERVEMMLSDIEKNRQKELIEIELNERVKERVEESQRDYYLREKLRAIKEELGDSGSSSDIEKLREKAENNPYPQNIKDKAKEEFRHLEMVPAGSGEAGVILSYIEWLLNVPWYQKTEDNGDLNLAAKILDEDHYGLVKVKERILEYLAVKQMTSSLKSPIICLVGPPGVGKTSLAKSVARALDRKFVKISLGGVRDEAEIRGHRRTYLGSLPGRIIQGMKKGGTTNPVFLIDEIDKMASDYKGDPSSAMLEVLDPEQNSQFSDHYLEEPYDLSDVLFIATANYLENIPAALKDRLEIISIDSYTEIEKLNIAKNHLIRKQCEINGLKKGQLSFTDDMILYLIRYYTREAGVRQLERLIGSVCRKAVLEILKDGKKSVKVTKKAVQKWLGHELFEYGTKQSKDQIGVVTGLAYTQFGGDVLPVEVNYFTGKGELVVTGQLGDVMVESTKIALDYIKSNADQFKIDPKFFDQHDIHIHVPEGAVPKDGPSAGVTLTTALVSAITGRPVSCALAMTGEVTLRGNVLPIGGLREKSMAAHRSGIRKIIIPKANLKDIEDIPEPVRTDISFIPVETVSQVIKEALV